MWLTLVGLRHLIKCYVDYKPTLTNQQNSLVLTLVKVKVYRVPVNSLTQFSLILRTLSLSYYSIALILMRTQGSC